MTTDAQALREALVRGLQDDEVGLFDGDLSDRLDALLAAVRAETLAGAGVCSPSTERCLIHEPTEHTPCVCPNHVPPAATPPTPALCVECKRNALAHSHDPANPGAHQYTPPTPPTPALTAGRLDLDRLAAALVATTPTKDHGQLCPVWVADRIARPCPKCHPEATR